MKEESIKKFEEVYKKHYFTQPVSQTETRKNHSKSNFRSSDLEKDLDSFYSDDDDIDISNSEEPWQAELNDYYAAKKAAKNENILSWWKKNFHIHPNLSKMARDILSTQATSVTAERLFSQASLIITNKRNSFKENTNLIQI